MSEIVRHEEYKTPYEAGCGCGICTDARVVEIAALREENEKLREAITEWVDARRVYHTKSMGTNIATEDLARAESALIKIARRAALALKVAPERPTLGPGGEGR